MNMIKEIIIHCSATPNGRDDRAADIHRWHLEKGWDGIGYHYVICVGGKLEVGRPEYWQGAHARGHNKDSLGVCLIGTDKFDNGQWETLETLTNLLLKKYGELKISGHNEVSNKTCPGFDVQKWLKV